MLDRRDLLRRLPPAAVAGLLMRRPALRDETGTALSFLHGVASGDPEADRVVLWTRVSGVGSGAPVEPVAVQWLVASDPELDDIVATGDTRAGPERDWTVHVDVDGLEPATTYWYAFEAGGRRSPTGRTRTAPAPDDAREVRLGVVACASYAAGFFTAYRRLAERDVDLVVHLGDYVYEDDGGQTQRQHEPRQPPVSLAEYRTRHAQYRTDPDLQELHRRFPMAAVWDDHEVAGNAWEGGSPSHDPATQGPWEQRRAAALRAYLEWVPVRRPDPNAPERIWRSLPFGANVELLLLDTRHDGRDRQVGADNPDPEAALADPDRRIMSPAQHEWLAGRLRSSSAAWRVLANQVLLSPVRVEVPPPLASVGRRLGLVVAGAVMNPDQWDGYPAARRRLLDVVVEDEVGPVVVLTGDIHSSWAFDVPDEADPANPPVAVELVTPSLTSASFASVVGSDSDLAATGLSSVVEGQLPHVRWNELQHHGYLVVGITSEQVQGDWWHLDAVDGSTDAEQLVASWAVAAGEAALVAAPAPLGDRPGPSVPLPPPPPEAAEDRGIGLRLGAAGAVALAAGGGLLALRRRRRR